MEQSEISKWHDMIGAYEKILHPDFFNPIRTQMNKVYEELKARAYRDAKISDEALLIEKEYKIMLGMINEHGRQQPRISSFSKKCFYKRVLDILKDK